MKDGMLLRVSLETPARTSVGYIAAILKHLEKKYEVTMFQAIDGIGGGKISTAGAILVEKEQP